NARTLVNTLHDVVLVPTAAVQRTQQAVYVYVVQPNKTVVRRTVVVSATQGGLTALQSGVKTAELVVTDGLDKLQPGAKVSVRLDTSTSTSVAGNGGLPNL